MKVTRKSPFTGKVNTMDIPVTQEQLDRYNAGGIVVQKAFPNLNPAQREFIKTGITPEEWDNAFGKYED